MSNTKHTPTPWAVDPGDHDDLLAACEAARDVIAEFLASPYGEEWDPDRDTQPQLEALRNSIKRAKGE